MRNDGALGNSVVVLQIRGTVVKDILSFDSYIFCRMNLFDQMSKEALQAIKETKSEMGTSAQQQKPSHIASKQDSDDSPESPDSCKEITPINDDTDSAIGTSSSLTSARNNSSSGDGLILPPANQFHKQTQANESNHHTRPVESPNRPKTCGEFSKLERIRPSTVCTNPAAVKRHSISGKGQVEALPPSPRSSQWVHTSPNMASSWVNEATTDFGKMNVFERLSSPTRASYKITARQRSNARLSLSMKRKEIRENSKPSFMFIQRDGAKSAMTAVNRQRSQSLPRKDSTVQRGTNAVKHSYEYKPLGDKRLSDYEILDDHVPELEARPFEITPPGYDYRFAAMKYDDIIGRPAYSDDELESCEIVKQAKIKCRQWLAHQMSVLADAPS